MKTFPSAHPLRRTEESFSSQAGGSGGPGNSAVRGRECNPRPGGMSRWRARAPARRQARARRLRVS
jgi:hypothetical protein